MPIPVDIKHENYYDDGDVLVAEPPEADEDSETEKYGIVDDEHVNREDDNPPSSWVDATAKSKGMPEAKAQRIDEDFLKEKIGESYVYADERLKRSEPSMLKRISYTFFGR